MAEVRLDRANQARLRAVADVPSRYPPKGRQLDWIANARAGSVRFDVAHPRWRHAGVFVRRRQQLLVSDATRTSQDAAAPSVVVDCVPRMTA